MVVASPLCRIIRPIFFRQCKRVRVSEEGAREDRVTALGLNAARMSKRLEWLLEVGMRRERSKGDGATL